MSTASYSDRPRKVAPKNVKVYLTEDIHQKAFDSSLLANIIFIVADGSIIQANRAACRLLGYSKKEILTKNRKDIFNVSAKGYRKVLKERKKTGGAKGDVTLVRKSGKLIPCEINTVIFKDANGRENSILSIVDLRERLLKQETIDVENEKTVAASISTIQSESILRQAKENSNWIESIAKTSYDVIWDWNLGTDIISFGKNYENVFGYRLPKSKISFREWMNLFNSRERKIVKKKMHRIFECQQNFWEDSYPFTSKNGVAGEVTSRANILRDGQGEILRIIGVIHDLSRIKNLEQSLDEAIRQKEMQIVDAIVESKEMERISIGKELHDNINQLLGASMLYLDMARKDGENGEIYLVHSSEYTLSAIDEIRKLSKGLSATTIKDYGLCGAIENMAGGIMNASPIRILFDSDHLTEEKLNEKFKLNVYRILQEQLNNIIRHAKASTVHISLDKSDTEFVVSITDDGIGYDISKEKNGLGISNINSRANIYKGRADFESDHGKGCKLVVTFPLNELCLEAY